MGIGICLGIAIIGQSGVNSWFHCCSGHNDVSCLNLQMSVGIRIQKESLIDEAHLSPMGRTLEVFTIVPIPIKTLRNVISLVGHTFGYRGQ